MTSARAERKATQTIISIRRLLRRSGLADRLEAVRAALGGAEFAERFAVARAAAPPANMEEVRGQALRVLCDLGVETTDVLLTFTWTPAPNGAEGGRLDVHARPHPAAVNRAFSKLREREGRPTLDLRS